MAAVREGRQHGGDLGRGLERRLARSSGARPRRLDQADRALGAGDREPAVGELDLRGVRLQRAGCEPLAAFDDLRAGAAHQQSAEPHRAAGMRAAAHARRCRCRRASGGRASNGTPSHSMMHLGEHGLVPLAARLGAERDGHAAVRQHLDDRALGRDAGRGLDEIGKAEPAPLAARLGLGAPRREALARRSSRARAPCWRRTRRCRSASSIGVDAGQHVGPDDVATAQLHAVDAPFRLPRCRSAAR